MLMNDIIKTLAAEMALLKTRIEKLRAAILAIQEVCEHDYAETGHDSHYRHYECTKCGKIEKA